MAPRRPAVLIVLLLAVLAVGCTADETAAPANRTGWADRPLSAEAMREDLEQYYRLVTESWAYVDSKRSHQNVDLTKSRDQLLFRITDDTTPLAFSLLLMQFAASLKDGHSEVWLPPSAIPFVTSWPIGMTWVEEQVVVTNLNYLADNPGISLGDQVLEVNGESIERYLQQRLDWTSASTDAARRVIAVDRLHWSQSPRVKLTFAKRKGGTLVAELACLGGQIDYRPRPPATFCTAESLSDGILYVRVPTFSWNAEAFQQAASDRVRDSILQEAKLQIDQAFAAVQQPRGLILDLRNNSGGYELLAIYVAQHLVAGDFVFHTLERRDSSALRSRPEYRTLGDEAFAKRLPQRPRHWQGIRHYDGPPFAGPLVVLINERCFSTTDNLCAFLKDVRPNTRFVGQPTHGGTGEPAVVGELAHSGAKVQFCVSRVFSPSGRMIEGSGTQPDLAVARRLDDLIQGRDAAKEIAVAWFKESSRKVGDGE